MRVFSLDYNEICGVCDDVDAVQRADGGYDPICALTGLSFADDTAGRLAMSKCPRLNEICREMANRWGGDESAELCPVVWVDPVRRVA